ncbi:hypothetical protein E1293_29910 [Actinomadura darangshiensis]|uniref:Uncharacterized protein n=1 Tax=Actinomadura darangshiensis TaxID=705336 RepID=A0A4R5ARC0_9ACTN|nr:hypothetical protein [Actinomadura darangshiensis]TDD74236.1 hypothetical protein E1293_29910 [Actinomadura darangshiensis]
METLRAALLGESERYHQLNNQLDSADRTAFNVLIAAAFFKGAYQRFGEGTDAAQVVSFIGDLRARYDLVEEIDPRVAERLLLATFSDEQTDDIEDQVKGEHYMLLLIALTKEAALSNTEVTEFLNDARKLADEWLGSD